MKADYRDKARTVKRQKDRQSYGQTDRQTDTQTYRQIDKQTDTLRDS